MPTACWDIRFRLFLKVLLLITGGGGAKQFAAYGALNGFNKQVNKREIQKFAFVCMARRNERVRN